MNYLEIAKKVSEKYRKGKNVVGIILVGSSTYGIEDEFVDIDIRLLINSKDKHNPMEQFVFEGVQIEVDEMSLDWLLDNTDYESEQSWIKQKAVFLYDPKNKIRDLFKKSNERNEERKEKLFWRTYSDIFNRHDVKKSIRRGENITAYMYVCRTIEMLTKFIFLLNNQPIPSFKWRSFFIRKYNLYPLERIEKIIPKGTSTKNLLNSLVEIKKLQQELQVELIKKGYNNERVMEPWRY